ncbi:hypothetical protein OSTOST_17066, partial [Ostertagia ostertagi]
MNVAFDVAVGEPARKPLPKNSKAMPKQVVNVETDNRRRARNAAPLVNPKSKTFVGDQYPYHKILYYSYRQIDLSKEIKVENPIVSNSETQNKLQACTRITMELPINALFAPSQNPDGRSIAVFIFPTDHELCYEWHFQKLLSDQQTALYMCCACRALKTSDRTNHPGPIPTVHIRDGSFVTDPLNPRQPHYCQPRSTPRALARRLLIERCNEIRDSPTELLRPWTVEISEVMSRISSSRFRDFTDPERRAMVEHVVQPSENGRDNARRVLTRAQTTARRRQDYGVIPGQLDPSWCRCDADGETFILLDEEDR